jgi:hypothetical protein
VNSANAPTSCRRRSSRIKGVLRDRDTQTKLRGDNSAIKLLKRSVLGTSKGIYVGGTLLSILLSLYLYTTGKRETGIFVGLWAPTVLNLGQTLVEDDKD